MTRIILYPTMILILALGFSAGAFVGLKWGHCTVCDPDADQEFCQ